MVSHKKYKNVDIPQKLNHYFSSIHRPKQKFYCIDWSIAVETIGHKVNGNTRESMYFTHEGATSISCCKPLKSVDQVTYVGCYILSAQSETKKCLAIAIERLSILRKFDFSHKMKWYFSRLCVSLLLYGYSIRVKRKCPLEKEERCPMDF